MRRRSLLTGSVAGLLTGRALAQPSGGLGAPGRYGPGRGSTIINAVRNSTMVGVTTGALGAGGVLPTNWFQGTTTAQTITMLGTGVEVGLSYIDIKIDASGAGASRIQVENPNPAWPSSATFMASLYARVVAGAFTNFNLFDFRVLSLPSTAQLATSMLSLSGGALSRLLVTGTSGASDTTLRTEFGWSSTGVGSVTLRLASPQLERGAYANAWVRTP
jgi:hypothetical protein